MRTKHICPKNARALFLFVPCFETIPIGVLKLTFFWASLIWTSLERFGVPPSNRIKNCFGPRCWRSQGRDRKTIANDTRKHSSHFPYLPSGLRAELMGEIRRNRKESQGITRNHKKSLICVCFWVHLVPLGVVLSAPAGVRA